MRYFTMSLINLFYAIQKKPFRNLVNKFIFTSNQKIRLLKNSRIVSSEYER